MGPVQIVLTVLSILFIIAVSLPLVKNDYWIFRIMEYPRFQKLIACIMLLIAWCLLLDYNTPWQLVISLLLLCCIVYLFYKVWPYLPFSKKEMQSMASSETKNQLKIFSGNVYQFNTRYADFLQQIKKADPDVILLLETSKQWEEALTMLEQTHPFVLKQPQENTYGLLFYSRFKLLEGTVKFLVEQDIPSIEAVLELPSGKQVKFYGLHPKPPVPGESSRSTAKDKELMKVAFKAKDEKLPVIVAGDLNDVAWSYVTELFRKTSELLDPRRGRGFYSTLSANNWLLRFPLDYVFCSNDFALINMKRLKSCGSDHFPILSHFEFAPKVKPAQPKPSADEEEKAEAVQKLQK